MVYLWNLVGDDDDALIGGYQKEDSPDRFEFQAGKRLPPSLGTPMIRFDGSLAQILSRDCLASSAMVPIVSEKCREILQAAAGDDVQFLPCRIAARDGETDGFSLLIATVKLPCTCKTGSVLSYVPGTTAIMGFSRLSLLEDCLGNHAIARDADYLPHLLVSDDVAKLLSAGDLNGLHLREPHEVYP